MRDVASRRNRGSTDCSSMDCSLNLDNSLLSRKVSMVFPLKVLLRILKAGLEGSQMGSESFIESGVESSIELLYHQGHPHDG